MFNKNKIKCLARCFDAIIKQLFTNIKTLNANKAFNLTKKQNTLFVSAKTLLQ
jgi:hypothetical protein